MNTATLCDGTTVDTSSEAWRLECEARAALRLDLGSRRAYLEGIEKKRGKAACDELKAAIVRVWTAGRVQT